MPNEVEQRLREIEERVSKASKGPWTNPWDTEPSDAFYDTDGERVLYADWYDGPKLAVREADAALIAHAPEDLRWATALLREREEEGRRLREAALIGQRWMKWWLEQNECDCEGAHTCGRPERQRELERINAALRVEQIDAAIRGEQHDE